MNKRSLLLLGFAVVVAAQLAVPAWMIIGHEWTLREGRVFKFRTRPVDPADAFRGRYVWLGLEPVAVKVPDANSWPNNTAAFAVLGTDSNGFAVVKALTRDRPKNAAVVAVRTAWSDVNRGEIHINLPGLDRYYLAEDKAPAADEAYRAHSRRTNPACYVTVRILGTHALIENLYIENQPIHEWLRTHRGK